jgi:hypothetical protein
MIQSGLEKIDWFVCEVWLGVGIDSVRKVLGREWNLVRKREL